MFDVTKIREDFPILSRKVYDRPLVYLPMQPYRERMASAPLDTLVVRCYPGEKGIENHYTLYEDDGQTLDY